MFLQYKVERKNTPSEAVWKFKSLKGLMRASDTVLGAKLLPDEIDVVVEASTEAPGGHLVQPQNWLVWIRDPRSTGKA